jgi:hypothetical protein
VAAWPTPPSSSVSDLGTLLKLAIAVAAAWVIWKLGTAVLGSFARPVHTPEPGELRKVNLRYRCAICGAEVRMTSAPDELPDPPRHCLEDMDLVANPFDD